MKKITLLASLFLTGIAIAQPVQNLKQAMELPMPKTIDDDMPGTRGASVVWHPVQKKYYAAFAGNIDFPFAIFDAKGERLSDEDMTCLADIRGLWYNPVKKEIAGNGYGEAGWFSYTLEPDGQIDDISNDLEGLHQPSEQSVGVYNTTTKRVLFLSAGKVYGYNESGELADSVAIHWGRTKAMGIDEEAAPGLVPEDYNYLSLVYTGIKGQELGFLNVIAHQVELYDAKTGFLTKKLALPEDAIAETAFNFAYANGMYWLFDIELRKWVGYK